MKRFLEKFWPLLSPIFLLYTLEILEFILFFEHFNTRSQKMDNNTNTVAEFINNLITPFAAALAAYFAYRAVSVTLKSRDADGVLIVLGELRKDFEDIKTIPEGARDLQSPEGVEGEDFDESNDIDLQMNNFLSEYNKLRKNSKSNIPAEHSYHINLWEAKLDQNILKFLKKERYITYDQVNERYIKGQAFNLAMSIDALNEWKNLADYKIIFKPEEMQQAE